MRAQQAQSLKPVDLRVSSPIHSDIAFAANSGILDFCLQDLSTGREICSFQNCNMSTWHGAVSPANQIIHTQHKNFTEVKSFQRERALAVAVNADAHRPKAANEAEERKWNLAGAFALRTVFGQKLKAEVRLT